MLTFVSRRACLCSGVSSCLAKWERSAWREKEVIIISQNYIRCLWCLPLYPDALASAQEFLPIWLNRSDRPEGKKEVIIISQNYIRCLRYLPCHSDSLASAQEFLSLWLNGNGRPEGKKEVIIISQNYIRCLRCLPLYPDRRACLCSGVSSCLAKCERSAWREKRGNNN